MVLTRNDSLRLVSEIQLHQMIIHDITTTYINFYITQPVPALCFIEGNAVIIAAINGQREPGTSMAAGISDNALHGLATIAPAARRFADVEFAEETDVVLSLVGHIATVVTIA